MNVLENTTRRVERFLAEIDRVGEYEFPYAETERSLGILREKFEEKIEFLQVLSAKDNEPEYVKRQCSTVLENVFAYTKLLGIIVRSTNNRNSFEVIAPLNRLATSLIYPDGCHGPVKLIISSEWSYSPIVVPNLGEGLEDFVVVGIPAPESSNALLIPLSAHEFGHQMWYNGMLEDIYDSLIYEKITQACLAEWPEFSAYSGITEKPSVIDHNSDDINNYLEPSQESALSQLEETFCDLIGLRVFGRSYIDSFAYLLSPRLNGRRMRDYPSIVTRAENLVAASASFGIDVPAKFVAQFDREDDSVIMGADRFALGLADKAVQEVLGILVSDVKNRVKDDLVALSDSDEVSRIRDRFAIGVPAEKTRGLPDILNAAWEASRLAIFSGDDKNKQTKLTKFLNDLTYKNIQLFELEQICEGYNDASR